MLKAIVYESNSGFTEKYASLLSEQTGLPAARLKEASAFAGEDVAFLGWLCAGSIKGAKKARARFNVCAVGAVGMATYSSEYEAKLQRENGLEGTPFFYMQGGLDMARLKGIYKFMLKAAIRTINAGIEADIKAGKPLSEETAAMRELAKNGGDCVCPENIEKMALWVAENNK